MNERGTVPCWNGKPITPGWWWLQFADGPGPRHWDGTFWDKGSYFLAAEDYAEFPILGPCPLPMDTEPQSTDIPPGLTHDEWQVILEMRRRHQFDNGRNAGLAEAAQLADSWGFQSGGGSGQGGDGYRNLAKAIRELQR